MKLLVLVFAVINLGAIATGGVGFTLGLVNYWSDDQDLFTSIMVLDYARASLCCVYLHIIAGWFQLSDVLGYPSHHYGSLGSIGSLPRQKNIASSLAVMVKI